MKGLHCDTEKLVQVISGMVPGSQLVRDIPGEATLVISKQNPKLLPGMKVQEQVSFLFKKKDIQKKIRRNRLQN